MLNGIMRTLLRIDNFFLTESDILCAFWSKLKQEAECVRPGENRKRDQNERANKGKNRDAARHACEQNTDHCDRETHHDHHRKVHEM